MKKISARYTFLFVLVQIVSVFGAISGELDHTRLMFVGEDSNILTIASGREESARRAPAVAEVIPRDMIKKTDSLGDLLSSEPGFYMPENEWGTTPYFRGIQNAVLFLYDTVPMGSNISKGLLSIDDNLSMAAVKRVEIIRGSGSVLWGQDAFAGIVNIVPLTGKDVSGAHTGASVESRNGKKNAYINYGLEKNNWDAFASLSCTKSNEERGPYGVVSFWKDASLPAPPENRYGILDMDGSNAIEFTGNASWKDAIKLSTRLSHYSYSALMSDAHYPWQEQRAVNSGFIKISGNKRTGINSIIRMSGAVSWFNPDIVIVDKSLQQKNSKFSGEMVYEHSFFSGQGILTAGLAIQEEQVENAPVWDTYFPDYFQEDNTDFLPEVHRVDYSNNLRSVLAQYLHKTRLFDFWVGARNDSGENGNNISYNSGVSWHPNGSFILKSVYGSGYRTQFAQQFHSGTDLGNEHIKTISFEAGWKPLDNIDFKTCLFKNFIDNHVVENSYSNPGISLPNSQEIEGIEFKMVAFPIKKIRWHLAITHLNASGPDNTFIHNDYSYLDENGTWVDHFAELTSPFDHGPDNFFNTGIQWKVNDTATFFADLRYFGTTEYVYLKDQKTVSYPDVWLADVSLKLTDLFNTKLALLFKVKNLFNTSYAHPGIYGAVEGPGINSGIFLQKTW